jgi:hypothetical protein
MSYHDGEYGNGSKRYAKRKSPVTQPCTCDEKYDIEDKIDPMCERCNYFKSVKP